ncbi:MAG: hypothetical protein NTV22_17360 [bacterium]|nr:hypothetical protein [bacterium]
MWRITCHPRVGSRPRGAAAIAAVVVLTTALFIGLAGLLNWSTNGYRHATRATTHARLFYAAESGLQYAAGKFKLLPRGGNFNHSLLSNEFVAIARSNFPPDIRLVKFTMSDSSTNATVMLGKYKGLYQIEAVYDIRCRVSDANDATHAVELQLKMGSLFLSPFQFGVFYNENLEIHPGADMIISGRVHCNKNIYMWPTKTLKFNDPITCGGSFRQGYDAGWSIFDSSRDQGQIYVATNVAGTTKYVKLGKQLSNNLEFDTSVSGATATEYFDTYSPLWAGTSLTRLRSRVLDSTFGTEALTLPFEGAEDYSRVLVDPPINGETTDVARVRMANRAAFLIETNDVIYYQTGPITNSEYTTRTAINNVYSNSFATRTNYFWNGRQDYTINPLDFNMGAFKTWVDSGSCPLAARDEFNSSANSRSGIIYVNQPEIGKRTYKSTNMAVRIINADALPRPLTIATPHALYIKGNYNIKIGTTANTNYPSAILSDCFTPLSSAWNDKKNISNNYVAAANTTYNTALIVGNSTSTYQNTTGGGLHNLPRFLENWSGNTITINGSMVCLYAAVKELAQHVDSNSDYYGAPTRNYLYDTRLGRYETSPPGVPNIYKYGLLEWAQVE